MSTKAQNVATASKTDTPVSIRVVEQLANAQGLDPRELPPLTRTIDLEALDNLIESTSSDTTVSFSVDGYDIIVTGNGTVSIDSLS